MENIFEEIDIRFTRQELNAISAYFEVMDEKINNLIEEKLILNEQIKPLADIGNSIVNKINKTLGIEIKDEVKEIADKLKMENLLFYVSFNFDVKVINNDFIAEVSHSYKEYEDNTDINNLGKYAFEFLKEHLRPIFTKNFDKIFCNKIKKYIRDNSNPCRFNIIIAYLILSNEQNGFGVTGKISESPDSCRDKVDQLESMLNSNVSSIMDNELGQVLNNLMNSYNLHLIRENESHSIH